MKILRTKAGVVFFGACIVLCAIVFLLSNSPVEGGSPTIVTWVSNTDGGHVAGIDLTGMAANSPLWVTTSGYETNYNGEYRQGTFYIDWQAGQTDAQGNGTIRIFHGSWGKFLFTVKDNSGNVLTATLEYAPENPPHVPRAFSWTEGIGCERTLVIEVIDLAPNSPVYMTNDLNETNCAGQTRQGVVYTDWNIGQTDANGHFVQRFQHQSWGTFMYTFKDNAGTIVISRLDDSVDPRTVTPTPAPTLVPTVTATDVIGSSPETPASTPIIIGPTPTSPFTVTATPTLTPTTIPVVVEPTMAPTRTPQPMPDSTYCEVRLTTDREADNAGTRFYFTGEAKGDIRAIRVGIGNITLGELGSTRIEVNWDSTGASNGQKKLWAVATSGNWETGCRAEMNIQIRDDNPRGSKTGSWHDNCNIIGCDGESGGGVNPTINPPAPSCSSQKSLTVGTIVLNPEALNLRAGSGLSHAVRITIPRQNLFTLIGGPQCGDGYVWWETQYGGFTGWVAEAFIIRNGDPIPGNPNPTPVPVVTLPPIVIGTLEPNPVDPEVPVFPECIILPAYTDFYLGKPALIVYYEEGHPDSAKIEAYFWINDRQQWEFVPKSEWGIQFESPQLFSNGWSYYFIATRWWFLNGEHTDWNADNNWQVLYCD